MIERLAAFLEREAGHHAVSLLLLAWGFAMLALKIPEGRDLITFALGVLARSMGSAGK